MLYNITINQLAITSFNSKTGFELNYRHAVMFEFFRSFFSSQSKEILKYAIRVDGVQYYWIKMRVIIADLPCFGFTDRKTVRRIISDLVACGIIRKVEKRRGISPAIYYAPGEKFNLFQKGEIPSEVKQRIKNLIKDNKYDKT